MRVKKSVPNKRAHPGRRLLAIKSKEAGPPMIVWRAVGDGEAGALPQGQGAEDQKRSGRRLRRRGLIRAFSAFR
jgi:hypothetical protein